MEDNELSRDLMHSRQ